MTDEKQRYESLAGPIGSIDRLRKLQHKLELPTLWETVGKVIEIAEKKAGIKGGNFNAKS